MRGQMLVDFIVIHVVNSGKRMENAVSDDSAPPSKRIKIDKEVIPDPSQQSNGIEENNKVGGACSHGVAKPAGGFIREEDVGITEYISTGTRFTGIIKQRY